MLRSVFSALIFFCFCLTASALEGEGTVSIRLIQNPRDTTAELPTELAEFDLHSSRDRAELTKELQKLIQFGEAQKADSRKIQPNVFPYEIGGGERKALEKCVELLGDMSRGGPEAKAALYWLERIIASFNHNYEYPIKKYFQLIPEVPYWVYKGLHHQRVRSNPEHSSSRRDPKPSTYWQPMANDGTVDLKAGFGRKAAENVDGTICTYKGPKAGWGAHPGFHVKCNGQDFKFKLGDEIYSGPFNTRLFWLMGYNVTPIDHVEEMKVAYDRKILSEFHSRKHLELQFKLLLLPIKKFVVTQYTDPFNWIKHAQMRDGRQIPGAELKKLLLRQIPAGDPTSPKYRRPETIPGNFREAFESQIEYLAFVPGALGTNSEDIKSVGPWKYNEFDAIDYRELRALMVLAAWVDQYNLRWENTRLSFVKNAEGSWGLKHLLSDVGSGLGGATRIAKMSNSDVDKMVWRVTQPIKGGVKLKGFQINDTDNDVFAAMSFEDAQWMVRKIAGISEAQIWDALSAAQMPIAEQRLAFEKLLARRAYMVRDFGLAREFPALVKRPINEEFSYTPKAGDGYGWDRRKVVDGQVIVLKK